ncbi:MAG: glycosyltransferase family 4 protein [Clostridiales bacterium]|nr:glycosyltransferase family 4 protein [Clostridiales bacterium]
MKALVVYPNNVYETGMGENARVMQILLALKEIGYVIDYYGYKNFWNNATFNSFAEQNSAGLIDKLFLFDWAKCNDIPPTAPRHRYIFKRILRRLRMLVSRGAKRYLGDWTRSNVCEHFQKIVHMGCYDAVILFYTYQANLLKTIDRAVKKIYFMEDSVFLQQYSFKNKDNANMTIGGLLDEELERLSLFDEIFCISFDEKTMYEKFVERTIHFFPHIQSTATSKMTIGALGRRWDVMFLGYNNEFNVEGLKWFLNEVYPKLNKKLRIVLVGSATKEISTKYENIDVIPFVPNLDEVYQNSKVSICPMFRGTGMKIKVVESMSRGLPVVCNARGIDGLPDKTMCGCMVTNDPSEFAEYIILLLTDEEFYQEKSRQVFEYYKRVFNRDIYIKTLRRVLGEGAKGK